MLMLQRAAENVNPSECNDPAVLLACSLGSDSCPAACQKKADDENNNTEKKDSDRVIAGDLDVSVVDYSSEVRSAPRGVFTANTIKFNASQEIQLDSLTLKRTGLGSQKAIKKIWLEKNGVAVTNSASVGSDGLAVLNFKSNRDVISSATEYQVVIELNADATVGDEFAFALQAVESTAKNTTISGTTNTYRVSAYTVVSLKAVATAYSASNNIEYKVGSNQDYIIWEFSLESDSKSDDRDIYVKSITFRANGKIDFADTFKNVKVYRDSKVVSNNVEVNGKDVTISLDKDVIKANRKAMYTIRAEVASLENSGDDIYLTIKDTKDIVADEEDTSFRTSIIFEEGATNPTTLTMNKYTFKGGKVTLEGASNFAKYVDAGKWASDVTIAKGTLTVTEPIELPKITIPYGANGWSSTDALTWQSIKRLTLKVGDKRYTADPKADGSIVFEDVTVRSTSDIELLVSLASNVTTDSKLTFPALSNKLMSGVGSFQNNDSDLATGDIAGSITVATVTVKTPKFTLSADSISKQETVVNDTTKKTVMKGKLEAKENSINVNTFTVHVNDAAFTANPAAEVEVYLTLDGSAFSNVTLNASTTSKNFNSLGTIEAGKSVPFEIALSPIGFKTGGVIITLDAQAKGTDSNGNDTETAQEYAANLTVKGDATIDLANASSSSSDRIVDPTNNVVIYEGKLDVKNWSTTLTSFELTWNMGSWLTITNPKLYVGKSLTSLEHVKTNTNASGFDFQSLTQNLEEGVNYVQVKADVTTTGTTRTPFAADDYSFDITDVKVNGKSKGKTSSTYFAKWFFTLSKKSTSDGSLQVEVKNTSDKAVEIVSIMIDSASWNVATASVWSRNISWDNQAKAEGTLTSTVSIDANGGSETIYLTANKEKTAKLIAVVYKVVDGDDTYNYIASDVNWAFGAWWQFYSSK